MARDVSALCGWQYDPRAVESFLNHLEHPIFATAAPQLQDFGEGKDVFFWEAEKALLGRVLEAWDQVIGECVSFGWGRGVQDLMILEIVLKNEPEKWVAEVATEPIYGGSRVEIGGGRIRGDGSVGAWAARWVKEYGILLRQKYGSIDLTTHSGNRATEYGKRGCPDSLEPIAKEHPVVNVTMVTNFENVRDSLAALKPVPVCSSQGFSMRRDANGFCRPEGTWNHCMLYRGVGVAKGNRPFVPCQQSWGNSPTGPNIVKLESGRDLELPQGVFAVDAEVVDRMVRRQPDSYSIAGLEGWKADVLDYSLW